MAPVVGRHVRVVTAYRPPACRYCAGHRGVVLAGTAGLVVRAVQPGLVVFRGRVGRQVWAVIRRSDGLTFVYGGVFGGLKAGPVGGLKAGQLVRPGDPLGTADTTIYVGVRRGDTPIDPATVMCLDDLTGAGDPSDGRRVARLVPADSL